MRIGLFADDDERWIAGVLYLQTVVHALCRLPASLKPDMHLLTRAAQLANHYDPLLPWARSLIRYDHPGDDPSWPKRLWRLRRSRTRKLPSRGLQRLARQAGIDVLFPCKTSLGPSFPVPWVAWIPDFQHRHLPEMFDTQELQWRDQEFQSLVDEAPLIVVSSEQARGDLLHFYRADPAQVAVYRFRTHAQPEWFSGDPAATAAAHGLPEKFLMFPSQFWKHKNHLTLIEAIARTDAADIHLVLTGKDGDYRHPDHPRMLKERIARLGLENRIHHLGLLPRMEQVQLMRRACAIVQPSLFEGWSMLVEDCRALGKTVLLSDIPVHREQAYARAHCFQPESADDLARLIGRLWPALQAGPDHGAEAEAREENLRLSLENGHHLLATFRRAAERFTPPGSSRR